MLILNIFFNFCARCEDTTLRRGGDDVVNTFCVNTLLTNVTVDLVDRKRDK